jgi:two-component system CheB/CheR fusion protein
MKAKKDIAKPTVLVVDDNKDVLFYFNALFKSLHVDCICCKNAQHAINEISNGTHFDIAFIDIYMPDINGLDLLVVFQELNIKVPLVAQTAYVLSGNKEKFIQLGFDEYLIKPIEKKEIIAILSKYNLV